jgi:citronellol/citronellal dehydrogenase
MQDINARGTFVCSKFCIPHLKRGTNPHILTLSPPIDLDPKWLAHHGAYTLAKYGMTLLTLGMAAEFAADGIAANTLWPRTLIATAAVQNLLGGDEAMKRSRKPEIYADSAYEILTRPSRECTGKSFLCEDVLRDAGVEDLSPYSFAGSDADLQVDLFVDHV